jgi:hypothetical protein
MSKRLGIKEHLPSVSRNVTPRRQLLSFASHRARIVCKPCNTHFKHLEDTVIPLIMPMATGRILSLGEDSQPTLALWAAKTAMMLIAARPEFRELVPQEHRDSVRYANRPPDDSWIGYFPWEGGPNVFTSDATTLRNQDPSLRLHDRVLQHDHAYTAIFTFGRLGFKAIGFIDGVPPGFVIRLTPQNTSISQFWPRLPGLIHWPPVSGPLTEADYPTLTQFAPLIRA